ncbi:MAG: transposase [Bacteroidetes bacterium]|nr:transposase [Bacteroidota bacterium]
MDKFKNKYRIPSARLQSWDYSSNGSYFITICTKNRKHYFGEIIEKPNLGEPIMQLNEIGQLAQKYWLEIPIHYPFIELGNFVVMPNHTHGILIINKPGGGIVDDTTVADIDTDMDRDIDMAMDTDIVETPKLGVSTNDTIDTNDITIAPKIGGKNEKWKPNSIGSILNQYKRIVTINARKIHAGFTWQSRFHDHIIRDAQSFERIQTYIENNPLNWKEDKFYKKQ